MMRHAQDDQYMRNSATAVLTRRRFVVMLLGGGVVLALPGLQALAMPPRGPNISLEPLDKPTLRVISAGNVVVLSS